MTNQEIIYDEVYSSDMDLSLIRLDSGFFSTPAYGSQEIVESDSGKRGNPYFYNTRKNPIEFQATFSPLDKEWTPEFRQKIFHWLITDTYKKFQTTDDLGKIYYVIPVNAGEIFTEGNDKGYITIIFRTNAYHAWSPIHYNYYDLADNTTSTIIDVYNYSNVDLFYYPKIQITSKKAMLAQDEIRIKNLTYNTDDFVIQDLFLNEVVGIDNCNKIIKSSLEHEGYYRIGDFNKHWLKLIYGSNRLEVFGRCYLEIKSQFPIIR